RIGNYFVPSLHAAGHLQHIASLRANRYRSLYSLVATDKKNHIPAITTYNRCRVKSGERSLVILSCRPGEKCNFSTHFRQYPFVFVNKTYLHQYGRLAPVGGRDNSTDL